MPSKKIIILALILAAVVVAWLLLKSPQGDQQSEEAVVLMRDGVFEPTEISVASGTKVVFKNQDTKPRWPASNLHPTHGLYPEFDPKEQIEVGSEWVFVFDKPGTWRYHDHLIPELRGTVQVHD